VKRILLIQQYLGRKEPLGAVFPLGLAYLATALEDQNDIRVFDTNLYDDPYRVLKDRIHIFNPDIVGISIRNIDSLDKRYPFYYFKTIQPTIDIIKTQVPVAKIVVGGPGFSIFAEEIMARIGEIDFGVYLEGEETFPELIDKMDQPEEVKGLFYREHQKVLFTGSRILPEFGKLPIPKRNLFEMHLYRHYVDMFGIQTKRGCSLKCVYCSYPFLNGNKIRFRSPEHVGDEIEYLIAKFGIREFMFVDGVFNSPIKQAMDICKEIIQRGLKVKWSAWCDSRNFTKEFIDIAIKAGCVHLPFSPDGVTDASLAALGKDIKTSDINRTLRLLKEYKHIRASFGFFCFIPTQTYWGLIKTLWYYISINVRLFGRGGASLAWIRIEPHTRIYDIALKKGIITEQTHLLPEAEQDLQSLFYVEPSMRMGEKITVTLLWLVKKIVRPVLGGRGMALKRLKKPLKKSHG